MKKYINRKSILITSVLLLLVVAIGTSLAYIFTKTEPVENKFDPSRVSCAVVENGGTPVTGAIVNTGYSKDKVQIKNTGNTDAYIRVAVGANWMSEDGKVWATKPVLGIDYSIDWAFDDAADPTDWEVGSDGYYYFTKSVTKDGLTELLINQASVLNPSPQEGYYLSIEIVASAIQAAPASAVEEQWGVTVDDDGTISK